jgi:hypothetical protein
MDIKKIFFLIFGIVFIVFLFTSDGHRFSMDEFLGQDMALRITTFEPHPDYIDGKSKNFFNLPIMNPNNNGDICSNGITCYPTSVFYSVTEVPFIAINHFFNIITDDTLVLSTSDFTDGHYVFWRNSENPDLIFMELFYGPFFSAFSVGIFFLICLEHKFTRKNSLLLSFLLAFSTILWAYSNTSLNALPAGFFLLLGYLFFKKFFRLNKNKFLLFSSTSLGFAFLIRHDTILFIIPIFFFVIINILKRNSKISSLIFYTLPILFSYFVYRFMPSLRYIKSEDNSSTALGSEISYFGTIFAPGISHIFTALFGLLFSPGVGLFIFSPILITVFFSFPDFFRKNKSECILILSFFIMTLLYHANLNHWHGLVAWGPRYLVPLVPFLLIPLGASLEQRNKKFMFTIILIFSTLGVLFNITYVIQDVHWFVWSTPGSHMGLFGLGIGANHALWINDIIIWTFQFSQLTHSILLMFTGLQHDVYLLHLLGTSTYIGIFLSIFSSLVYLFWRQNKYGYFFNKKF